MMVFLFIFTIAGGIAGYTLTPDDHRTVQHQQVQIQEVNK